jgi:hypothetical protein
MCSMYGCPYDHNELEPESRHVLEYVVKCSPCPQKSECRASDCYYGHICQKDGCQGQTKGCRMKADLHNVDPKLASMVPAEDEVDYVHGQDEGVQMHGQNNRVQTHGQNNRVQTHGQNDRVQTHGQNDGVQMPDEDGYNW